MDNPFVGVGFHAVGGVAHGSFYVPLKRVRAWAWESAWLAQGVAAWGIMPWLVAALTGAHPVAALHEAPWCLYLGLRNRSFGDYIGRLSGRPQDWTAASSTGPATDTGVVWRNYAWASLSGATWYVGFMLYGIGATFMGRYDFTSWSIHLAFVIVFSTLCGILAREWQGVGRRTSLLIVLALFVLVSSTFVIAIGNRLATAARETSTSSMSRHRITHHAELADTHAPRRGALVDRAVGCPS